MLGSVPSKIGVGVIFLALWLLPEGRFFSSLGHASVQQSRASLTEEAAYWERIGTWKDLRRIVDLGDSDRAKGELKRYVRQLEKSGIPYEGDVALAASLKARQASRLGAEERAELWLEVTESLRPDSVLAHKTRLELSLQRGPGGWVSSPLHMIQMMRAAFQDPHSSNAAWSLLGLIMCLVLSFVGVFFLSASAVHKLPYLRHRLDHWAVFSLPEGLFKAWAFSALLIAFSLGFGLLPSLLALTAVLAVFQTGKDKVALTLVLVSLGTLPALCHWFWTHQAYESSQMAFVERCEQGDCFFFKERTVQAPFEAEQRYGKGLMLLRKADLIGAEIELKSAQKAGLSDPGVDVALGNVQMLRLTPRCPLGLLTPDLARWVKDAQKSYKIALAKNESTASAHYGLALSELILGNEQKALGHLERYQVHSGVTHDPATPPKLSICPDTGTSFLAQVRWEGLTREHRESVSKRIFRTRGIRNLLPYQEWLLGSIHVQQLALYSILLALFVILVSPTTSRALGCGRCSRCSDLYCGRCTTTEVQVNLCQKCLMDRLQIAIADPQDVWRRQVLHDRRSLSLGRWVLVSGVLVPGLGSVLRGWFWRGLILLTLLSLGLVLLLGGLGHVPGWPSYSSGFSWAHLAPSIWILLPTYVWGFLEARHASRVELK